jgi:hypothetical protein
VTATATSGLTVTLTSTTTGICSVSGFDVALLAAGTCSITATQPGDATVKPATSVVRSFTVSQATQAITFANPGTHGLGQTPFVVTATASSGLAVSVTSTTLAVCTVDGFDVSLLAPGTCSLTASQSGNTQYKAATTVVRAFTVTKVTQTITIPNPGPQTLADPAVTLAPFSSSGLTVVLTSNTKTVCTVSGTTLTLKKVGTCSVTGTQAGNATYAAATPVTLSITVTATGTP